MDVRLMCSRTTWRRMVSCVLAGLLLTQSYLLPAAAFAGSPQTLTPAESLDEAREFLRSGQYPDALRLLETLVTRTDMSPDVAQEAYLLLVNTSVLFSNDFRSRGDFVTSDLYMDRAGEYVRECFEVPKLRHTRPEPEVDFPPETVNLFRTIRAETFGTFRVTEMEPPDAVAILDGDTLSVPPGERLPEVQDVPIGPHEVEVHAEGYRSHIDEVVIEPGTTLARSYMLERGRGFFWYASRGLLVTAGAVGAVLLWAGEGDSGPSALGEPPPLPER